MKTSIVIYTKTPFNTFVKSSGVFDKDSKILTISDDKNLNDNETYIDLNITMNEDIKSIIKDVKEQISSNFEKYHDYNYNDIELDSIKIEGEYITCNYTINAGSYRRICVGFISKVLPKNGVRHTYIVYPPSYRGSVCW